MTENEQQLIELIHNAKNPAALYAVANVAIAAAERERTYFVCNKSKPGELFEPAYHKSES